MSIFLILLLAGILRLPGISQSLWLDEAAQAVMSSAPLSVIWRVDGDFHPPLFHYLLHFWMQLSTAESWMRLLPVIFGVATIYVVYLFALKFFKSEKIARLAALLLAISPYHVWYSQELRSYSLVTFLTMLSTYLIVQKKWRLYLIINVLAFFANYMYIFVIAAQFLFLIFYERKSMKNFIVSQMFLTIAFVFWWPEFYRQLDSGRWLTMVHPEWKNLSSPNFIVAIPLTFAKFIFGRIAFEKNILYLILLFLMLSVTGWIVFHVWKLKKNNGHFLIINLLFPILLAWFVSFWIPLNGPWRLTLVLPFLWLIIAYYIEKINDKHLIYIFITISFFGIFMQNLASKNRKEDWRGAVEFINQNVTNKKKALVVFEFIAPFAPWQWYEKSGIYGVGVVPAKANEKDLNAYLSPALIGKNQIYLFEYFADVTDPNRLVRKYLEARQFKVTDYYEFNNLGFIYEMKRILL